MHLNKTVSLAVASTKITEAFSDLRKSDLLYKIMIVRRTEEI